ncbi:Ubiquinone biosynthesis protein COQ4 like, mitochondrial, partial [Pseudolycoriella hygida]
MITNALTAANGVFVKKKLESIDMVVGAYILGDVDKAYAFDAWHDPLFVIQFVMNMITEGNDDFSFFEAPPRGIVLRVNASSEIQIALTAFAFVWNPIVEILIGTNNNTRSEIRINQQTNVVTVPTPNILQQGQWNDFRVVWANQVIHVYRGNDSFPFMSYTMQLFFPVNFYGVRAVILPPNITLTCVTRSCQRHLNVSFLSTAAVHEEHGPISEGDKFTKEFLQNHVPSTQFQKIILSAGSSLASLINPHRHDMIACLGETTGTAALNRILEQMKSSDEGQQILQDKPRINSNEIDLESLGQLPEETFGFHYKKFLDDNNVTPDSRMPVRFLDDPELAYVMTRYRECHDLVHTILGMPTNMLGEVSVKWVEALNNGLPMCYGGAIFGAMRLRPKQRQNYAKYYLPWALECGRKAKPLLNVYWEQRWTQRVGDLRDELNINTHFGEFVIGRDQFLPMLETCFSNMRYVIDTITEGNAEFSFFEGPPRGTVLRVNASSEIQIALTAFAFVWNPIVEILIGTNNNTRSEIRINQQTNVVTVPTPNILQQGQWNDFRVVWANQVIHVYRGSDSFPFMSYTMQWFFPVNFYGVRA